MGAILNEAYQELEFKETPAAYTMKAADHGSKPNQSPTSLQAPEVTIAWQHGPCYDNNGGTSHYGSPMKNCMDRADVHPWTGFHSITMKTIPEVLSLSPSDTARGASMLKVGLCVFRCEPSNQ